jgi:hypothetical protein
MIVIAVSYQDTTYLQIDCTDLAVEKADPPQQLANRVHDVCEIEITGGYLVQHRCE